MRCRYGQADNGQQVICYDAKGSPLVGTAAELHGAFVRDRGDVDKLVEVERVRIETVPLWPSSGEYCAREERIFEAASYDEHRITLHHYVHQLKKNTYLARVCDVKYKRLDV